MQLRGMFIAAAACGALAGAAGAQPLKISQVYGGGGSTTATFRQDYVELFNAGAVPIDLAGMSIQYSTATSSVWNFRELFGVIQPGAYFLIRMDETTSGLGDVPIPFDYLVPTDLLMTATSFKVALVNSTTALAGCPSGDSTVIDLVGFGTANCSEGGAAAGVLSTTTAGFRNAGGCEDTDNNSVNFLVDVPNPRNSASTLNPCPLPPGSDLSVSVTGPMGTVNIGQNAQFNVVVTNFGPDLGGGIELSVPIPANVTFVSSVPAGMPVGGVLTLSLPDLAPGASANATIELTADAGPRAEVAATVSSMTTDPVAGNNTAVASAPVYDRSQAKVIIGVDDAAQGVYVIDVTSGASELLFTAAVRALASDDGSRRIFYSTGSQLWAVPYDEPRTPSLIGTFNGVVSSVSAGLAYDSIAGRLLATDGTGRIFSVDTTTATTTLLSDYGVGDFQGADFDPVRNRLICTSDSTSTTPPHNGRGLYLVDPAGTEMVKLAEYPIKSGTSLDTDIDGCAYGEGVIYPVADERLWFYRYSESLNSYIDPFETPYGADELFSGATYTAVLFDQPDGSNLGVLISGPGNCAVPAGGVLTYSITVNNVGPDLGTGVVLTNTLPAGTTFVSSSPPLVPAGGELVYNIGDLAAGASAVLTVDVQTDVGAADVSTTASVVSGSVDPFLPNNSGAFAAQLLGGAPATAAAKGIFSTLAGTNTLPGEPGLLISNGVAMNRPFRSYNGVHWAMTIDTDAADTATDRVLVRGSGTSFASVAREGVTAVGIGNVIGNFDGVVGINDAGEFAFGTNLNDGDEAIIRSDDDGFIIVARENTPVPADANWTYGGLSNGATVQNDGTVSFHTNLIGPPTINDTVWLTDNGATVLAQEQVTVPGNQIGGALDLIESMSSGSVTGQGIFLSADGTSYSGRAILTSATAVDTVIIVDGNVVIQEGAPLPGSSFVDNVSLLAMNFMEPHGDWLAYGSNFNGTSTNGVDWVVRNGELIAARDQEIFPGAGLLWSENTFAQTFFNASSNRFGDFVVGGLTSDPDLTTNAMVVFNASKILLREGDPIDMDNNGVFDDDAYIHVFRDDFGFIAEDGYYYTAVDLRNGAGLCSGTPTDIGEAFIRVRAFCPADWNRDEAVNSGDISSFLTAWLAAVSGGGVRADVNGDTVVNSGDISAFLSAWLAAVGGGC